PRCGRRPPRGAAGQGRRLCRRDREHVGGVDPAHAVAAARRRSPAPRPEGADRRGRRRLHLGRRRDRVGARL
ncbi:MAG: 3-oxoacyl-[acyl-carrier-protein] synthase, KASIII, partial [uncultured Solirubrobacteraceae bacterium]